MNLYKGYLVRSEKRIAVYADAIKNVNPNIIEFLISSQTVAIYPAAELVIDEIIHNCEDDSNDNCVL